MTDLLSIGASGINVYQRALSTVSNNIANLNTEGYSKQTTEISQNEPQAAGRGFIGTGAYFNRVARQYDSFLEQSLQRATADLESQQANAEFTTRLLDFLGDDDIGLVSALNKFFSSAQQMSTDPASSAYRSTMLRSSEELTTRINSLAEQLDDLGDQAYSAIEAETESLNALATQLGTVNSQLLKKKSEKDQPPALLDRRDQLLRDISEYAGISTKVNSQGLVTVSLAASTTKGLLVDDLTVRSLSVSRGVKDPDFVRYTLNGEGGVEQLSSIGSGSISGYSNFLGSSLKQSKVALNDLVRIFADEVNAIQTTGLDLNGDLGQELFVIEPSVSVDQSNTKGALLIGTRALDGDVPEFDNTALTWSEASQRWSAVDPATGQIQTSDAEGRITLANLVVTITGAPQEGDRVLLSTSNAPARGIRVGLETGSQIAAASLFRVTPSETNRGGAVSSVSFNPEGGLSGYDEIAATGSYTASERAPIGVIPAGQNEVVLELDPTASSGGSIQLMTRDGVHVLGNPNAVADFDTFFGQNDFFEADTTYSNTYLNAVSAETVSYKDYSIEYGAYADSAPITQLTPLMNFGFNDTSSTDFTGGYLEFTVQAPKSNTALALQTVTTASSVAGAVSVVGSDVFLGDGTTSTKIGEISYPYGTVSSGEARLRLQFEEDQFENASFEVDAVGSTTITGWSVVTDQIILGTTVIEGVLTPLDPAYPAGNQLTDTGGSSPILGTRTAEVVAGGSDGQGQAIRLQSTGQTSNANGIIRSPAVVSDSIASVSQGDTISFDWKATGSGDAYDVFGYFINETTGDTHVVLNQTGASASTSTDWATVDFAVPDSGDYRFVFISGSYDASGGTALGGELLLDNIKISRQESRINPSVVDQIAKKLMLSDDRDLIGATHPYRGDLIVQAYDAEGDLQLNANIEFDSGNLVSQGAFDPDAAVEASIIRSDRIAGISGLVGDLVIASGEMALDGTTLGNLTIEQSGVEGYGALSALDVAAWLNAASVANVTVSTSNDIRVDSDSVVLAGPGLEINGTAVTSLNGGTQTVFADLADLMHSINAISSTTAVEAEIDATGALVLRNTNGLGANIQLDSVSGATTNALGRANGVVTGSFAIREEGAVSDTLLLSLEDGGLPADLNTLGLNTQIRIRGAIDEEIGVFLTGGAASVNATLTDSGIGFADGLRGRVYEASITDEGNLQILDQSTDTVLVTRAYAGETEITYQGITMELRAPAEIGDVFVIDGNNTGPGQAFDAQGNNQNLMRIVDLEKNEIVNGLSITDAYLSIVGDVGNQATQAEISVEALSILKDQAIEARDRVSGVSLDQEAADLIRFQQAYQASAQVMQVASKLFDAILQVR